jgi:protein-L-isoaspartate O-methyltransferase
MSDLWREASQASERFAAQALDYHRYRPRYPQGLFDDIVRLANLSAGDKAIEIGAGTGIATQPLVECDLDVTAIEPAVALAAVAESNLRGGLGSSWVDLRTSHLTLPSGCWRRSTHGTGSTQGALVTLLLDY